MGKSERIQFFRNVLDTQGFRTAVDDDGDVSFSFQDMRLYLFAEDKDERCLMIFATGFWNLLSATELMKAYVAANEVNNHVKVAKLTVLEKHKNMLARVEFLGSPEELKNNLARGTYALVQAVQEFVEIMRR